MLFFFSDLIAIPDFAAGNVITL